MKCACVVSMIFMCWAECLSATSFDQASPAAVWSSAKVAEPWKAAAVHSSEPQHKLSAGHLQIQGIGKDTLHSLKQLALVKQVRIVTVYHLDSVFLHFK